MILGYMWICEFVHSMCIEICEFEYVYKLHLVRVVQLAEHQSAHSGVARGQGDSRPWHRWPEGTNGAPKV